MRPKYLHQFLLLSFILSATLISAQLHTWIELGPGIPPHETYPYIRSIWCDGGNNIYAAGDFLDANGYRYVAKWDGQSWSELGTGANALNANSYIQCITGDANGNIYAAGDFKDTGGYQYVAKWNGTNWSELGTPAENAAHNPAIFVIYSIITDPAGNLYAGSALVDDSSYIAVLKWDGNSWSSLGLGATGLNVYNNLYAICRDPSGNIYAAGTFTDSVTGLGTVAKWDGTRWSRLGTGANALNANSGIQTLCSDPSGNIYAAGSFTDSGNVFTNQVGGARYVAKWNGNIWTRLGGTTDTFFSEYNSLDNIFALTSDAAGNIYAAGGFRDSALRPYVAKWDGTHWTGIGISSNDQLVHNYIYSICFDHSGNLYASGNYDIDTGTNVNVAVYINQPLGIVGIRQTNYDLYPNPTGGIVTVHLSEALDATLTLCDMSGHELRTWQCTNEDTKQLNISAYAPGLYLLRIETTEGESSVIKILRR